MGETRKTFFTTLSESEAELIRRAEAIRESDSARIRFWLQLLNGVFTCGILRWDWNELQALASKGAQVSKDEILRDSQMPEGSADRRLAETRKGQARGPLYFSLPNFRSGRLAAEAESEMDRLLSYAPPFRRTAIVRQVFAQGIVA